MSSLSAVVDFAFGLPPKLSQLRPTIVHCLSEPNEEIWHWLREHAGAPAPEIVKAHNHIANVHSRLQTMRHNGSVATKGEPFRYFAVERK